MHGGEKGGEVEVLGRAVSDEVWRRSRVEEEGLEMQKTREESSRRNGE